jgi:integrase
MLEIYRRHNRSRCTSTDTQKCKAKRPCPIWIRGVGLDNRYIRRPLKTRDWNRAMDHMRLMEAGQEIPKPAIAKSKPNPTLEEWRDAYVAAAESENVRSDTIRKYRLLFKLLIEFANGKGIRHPEEFDIQALREFRATWKDQAPASRLKKQERLKKIFAFAFEARWVETNEAKSLGKILVDPTQKNPFEDTEMESILEAARDNIRNAIKSGKPANVETARATYAFILVLRYSGLRISDVCMLKRDALKGDHLAVRAIKNKGNVTVLLPSGVADQLRAIKPATPRYFFWNESSKLTSVTDLWRNRRLKEIFKDAGIKGGHPHRFRHTFAASLLNKGKSAKIVADLLGNSEKIVEKHYSAWVKARQQGLDEALTDANQDVKLISV